MDVILGSVLRTRHSLHGVGGQFDHHLSMPDEKQGVLSGVISAAQIGHSRIFVPSPLGRSGGQEEAMDAVRLAHRAGVKSINLTWMSGPYFDHIARGQPSNKPCVDRTPHGDFEGPRLMKVFAKFIHDARAETAGVTHVTIQNEVNSVDIALECKLAKAQDVYRQLYQLLATELRHLPDPQDPSRTLKDAVDLIGGDLVLNGMKGLDRDGGQDSWLRYMHDKMADTLDGYSVHVYWEPGEPAFPNQLTERLTNLQHLLEHDLNSTHELYVTEYGVRKLGKNQPGTLVENGVVTNMADTKEAGFQHAWFNALAPHYGCTGLTKWSLYRTEDPKSFGLWGMIGTPKESFSESPTYHATALFNRAVGQDGWTANSFLDRNGLLVSRFNGPNGAHSVFILNGAKTPLQANIHGLLKNGQYFVAVWNGHDDGKVTTQQKLPSNAAGVAVVGLIQRRMVVLSTNQLAPQVSPT